MRLLQRLSDNTFAVTPDLKHNIPDYAILSHTWLQNDGEITFDDIQNGDIQQKAASYKKIRFCADLAAKDGLRYLWVDTCCIDKSNSQELQEAITRMFEWYKKAMRCYVYLADVSISAEQLGDSTYSNQWQTAFRGSRWFTRGWTLQELLAPSSVEFYSSEATWLGDKKSLQRLIHQTTKIPLSALQEEPLSGFSVTERLSWAEGRQTTLEEDKAYCLLGLFTIFMPLLYGEGENHAFSRLRNEIERESSGNSKHDNILETLPKIPQAAFNSLENQHVPTCLGNTRVELLQEISDWADESDGKSIFWLNGIAGTGKSTISRTIARKYNDRGTLGGSFFFSKIGGVNHAERIFTTLAWQLANKIPAARRHICDAIMKNEDVAFLSLRDQWDQLIMQPLAKLSSGISPSAIVLVIDALDECESDQDIRIILRLLAAVQNLPSVHLRVFITSRPEISVRVGFLQIPDAERQVFFLHDIPVKSVNRDLELFFKQSFDELMEERGFPSNWPGMRFIHQLVDLSCGLFIWASTACRYIREGRRLALKRIQTLIQGKRASAAPEKRLDEIYTTVLRGSIQEGFEEEEKQELYKSTRSILGSIVIFRTPLSANDLSSLLSIDVADVDETLADLHTILNVPYEKDRQIRLHHPSFRDFLLNKERCTDLNFWVDEKEANKALADHCVDLMSNMLKRNICNLSSPGVCVKDIDPSLVKRCIPPELQYACIYWAEHYRGSGVVLRDDDKTCRFFKEHYLHWLEAMSLMGRGSEMSATIRMYESLLTVPANPNQIPFVRDARKLIFAFQTIIEKSPLQVYCATLAFIPSTNQLNVHFQAQLHPWLQKVHTAKADIPEVKEEWNYVNDIVFTSDGRYVASGSVNEVVRVWDVATKAPYRKFTGQLDKICSLAITPDCTIIAAGSDDSTVMAWDMMTGSVRYHLTEHTRWVNALQFSPNGKLLVSGSMDETILVHQATTGELLKTLDTAKSCVNGLAFSLDGNMMASATVDELVRLWRVPDFEIVAILDGHSGPVNNVRFSPNGKYIASASDDMTIKIWDVSSGVPVHTLRGHSKKVWSVAYSPSGLQVASGSEDRNVMLWDANTGSHTCTLSGHHSGINCVVYSPSGKIIASGSFDDEVRFWDAENEQSADKLEDFEDRVEPAPLSRLQLSEQKADGAVTADQAVSLEKKKKNEGHSSTITAMVVSPDGTMVASGSRDTKIKLWTKDSAAFHQLVGHTREISFLVFSSDSHLLASVSTDETIKVWNTKSGSIINTLRAHPGSITYCRFSLDSSLLVTCSRDARVVLWDTIKGVALHTFTGHSSAVNSALVLPGNNTIVSCSADTTIRVWDIGSGNTLHTLEGHTGNVNAISLSSDAHFLASGCADNTVRFWNLVEGKACGVIRGHALGVNSVSFLSDDKRVVSCSDDSTVKIWDFATQSLLLSLHTDVIIRRVSFGREDQKIETDRGILDINVTPDGTSGSTQPGPSLFITDEWIQRDNRNALYIPPDYQIASVAAFAETAVLGLSSGSVVFVTFN